MNRFKNKRHKPPFVIHPTKGKRRVSRTPLKNKGVDYDEFNLKQALGLTK